MTVPAPLPHERLLTSQPLFARVPESDLRVLARAGRLREYRPGQVIFREGGVGDSLHVIARGSVRIVLASEAGGEATLALLGPGECVGDLAVIDGLPRSASAIAQDPVQTLAVSRQAFLDWLGQRPAVALLLLETLGRRLRATDEALSDLTFLGLGRRLAKRLLALRPPPSASATEKPIAITQEALGSMLGVSRESVNKQLNAFARQGWIRLGRARLTILDPEALRRFEG